MIIVMKPGIPAEEELRVKSLMEGKGFQIHESRGANFTLFGVVGDTAAFDMNQLRVYDCIDKVMRVQEPYKRANRMFHPEDSIVDVCGVKVGGKTDHGNGRPLFSRDAGTDYRRGGGCEANGRCDPAWRRF